MLDSLGRFWNEGVAMEHAGMARAFASWVRRHPHDGRYILSNGFDWTYFEVEDAPFHVRSVDHRDGVPWLTLTDGSEEPLDPAGVMVGNGDALYVKVRRGEFDAKLLPRAQAAMVDVLVENESGVIGAEAGGKWYPLGTRQEPLGRAEPEVTERSGKAS